MKSLLDSRKFWLTVVGVVCTTAVVITCLFLKVPETSMLAIAGAIVGLLFKLIDGIAREDAAKATPPPLAQAGGTIINNSSRPPAVPDIELTPTEVLRASGNWPGAA
jgi:hypothetical protein